MSLSPDSKKSAPGLQISCEVHLFNCPLSSEKAGRLVEQLELTNCCSVVDIGCGEGEFLIRVAERYEIAGVGIDKNSDFIKLANRKAKQRIPNKNVSFVCEDAQAIVEQGNKVDLMLCIGSEFIFGGYPQALQQLSRCLTNEGMLLIGTVFWKQSPSSEYLSLMEGKNPHFDYLTTVDIAVKEGFVPLYLCRSSKDEWDDFEGRYTQKHYQAAIRSANEVAFEKIQNWQRGYLRWGRETMGFGFFLLQKC